MRIHRQPIWPADQSLDAKEDQSDPHNGNPQEDGFFSRVDGAQSAPFLEKILGSCKTNFSNKGQVAVALGEINTIANNKFIGNFKA